MNMARRPTTAFSVVIVCVTAGLAAAQNPKPPTPLPAHIQSVDQLPPDAVVLWIDENDLTVYIDSTSNPDDQNKITTLEIRWVGPGAGFVKTNCCGVAGCSELDVVCRLKKLVVIQPSGIGPVYSSFTVEIPDAYMENWNPAESWTVDGSYLTGGPLDKFDPNSPYFGPVVPEPPSLTLIFVGLILLRRRC